MDTKTPWSYARLRALPLVGSLALGMLSACGPIDPHEEPGLEGRTGLKLTMRLDDKTDVAGMRYEITRRSCQGERFTPHVVRADRPLEEIRLPGGIPDLIGNPFDGNSSHVFADFFTVLPAGCYDVSTQPLTAQGTPSQDCSPASTWNVYIADGQTTETLLINQCWGEGRGAIDVISALNHPPELVSVTFERSKFVYQCENQVVCATMRDPDGDPLEFTWAQVGGPALLRGPEVLSTTRNDDGSVTQCVLAVAQTPARYELKVVAYDLMHDRATGQPIRIQDFLFRNGNLFPSNDSLTFPFYAADAGLNYCPVNDGGGGGGGGMG
jgi:hypothetical protein